MGPVGCVGSLLAQLWGAGGQHPPSCLHRPHTCLLGTPHGQQVLPDPPLPRCVFAPRLLHTWVTTPLPWVPALCHAVGHHPLAVGLTPSPCHAVGPSPTAVGSNPPLSPLLWVPAPSRLPHGSVGATAPTQRAPGRVCGGVLCGCHCLRSPPTAESSPTAESRPTVAPSPTAAPSPMAAPSPTAEPSPAAEPSPTPGEDLCRGGGAPRPPLPPGTTPPRVQVPLGGSHGSPRCPQGRRSRRGSARGAPGAAAPAAAPTRVPPPPRAAPAAAPALGGVRGPAPSSDPATCPTAPVGGGEIWGGVPPHCPSAWGSGCGGSGWVSVGASLGSVGAVGVGGCQWMPAPGLWVLWVWWAVGAMGVVGVSMVGASPGAVRLVGAVGSGCYDHGGCCGCCGIVSAVGASPMGVVGACSGSVGAVGVVDSGCHGCQPQRCGCSRQWVLQVWWVQQVWWVRWVPASVLWVLWVQ